MKRPLIIFFMLASLSIVILGFQSLITEPEVAVNINDNVVPIVSREEPVDIMLATDLHYLTDALIEKGPVFDDLFATGDGKMLYDLERIVDAFITQALTSQPDVVVLSGDLTLNGEKLSHEHLSEKLDQLQAAGIVVFVTPGNHDLNNYHASRFTKEAVYRVEKTTPDAFRQMYQSDSSHIVSMDDASLSYVAAMREDAWLVMLDTVKYENNSEQSPSEPSGRVRLETELWLEDVLRSADEQGVQPIVVSHHNLLEHHPHMNRNFTIEHPRRIKEMFQTFGVRTHFSGHIHVQHTAVEGELYDVATGALSVYPHLYGAVTLGKDQTLHYQAKSLTIPGDYYIEGSNKAVDFHSYSQATFEKISYDKAMQRVLLYDLPLDETRQMATVFSKFNTSFFSGTLKDDHQQIKALPGYGLWDKAGDTSLKWYMFSELSGPFFDHQTIEIRHE